MSTGACKLSLIQSIQQPENKLEESFEGYVYHVEKDDATILDVMMSVEYTHSEAQPPNGRAIGHIDDARFAVDRDTDEGELVLQYQSEARAYADLMRYQRNHGELYDIFDDVYTVIAEEEPDVETINPPTETHEEREEEFEELMEEFEDVDSVVGELYDDKMTQLERELDIANEIITGINYILDPGFGTQQERAALAKNTFRTVASQIEDPDDYPPTNQTDGDLVDLVNEWEELAEEIEQELRIL